MSADENYLGEPIPLDEGAEKPSTPPPGEAEEDLFKPAGGAKASAEPSSKIRTFASESTLGKRAAGAAHRALNKTGQGATRLRTFHAKLADASLQYMEDQINEWLDGHPDVEVKFAETTVGVVEGKRAEPHLIITVWY